MLEQNQAIVGIMLSTKRSLEDFLEEFDGANIEGVDDYRWWSHEADELDKYLRSVNLKLSTIQRRLGGAKADVHAKWDKYLPFIPAAKGFPPLVSNIRAQVVIALNHAYNWARQLVDSGGTSMYRLMVPSSTNRRDFELTRELFMQWYSELKAITRRVPGQPIKAPRQMRCEAEKIIKGAVRKYRKVVVVPKKDNDN
jgi:hypothetical protein